MSTHTEASVKERLSSYSFGLLHTCQSMVTWIPDHRRWRFPGRQERRGVRTWLRGRARSQACQRFWSGQKAGTIEQEKEKKKVVSYVLPTRTTW